MFAISLLCLNAVSVSDANAWGPDGHRIVCFVADEHLKSADRKKLRTLLKEFQFEGSTYKYYSSSCNFADVARARVRDYRKAKSAGDAEAIAKLKPWNRYSEFNRQHYINIERDDPIVDPGDCDADDGCILSAIEFHTDQARNGTTFERIEALVMLGHWIGDLHQPMHVSFSDDLGANRIDEVDGLYGDGTNLHRVWDSGIIKVTLRAKNIGWLDYARELSASITDAEKQAWSNGDVIAWTQESYDITRAKESKYCRLSGNACVTMGAKRTLGRAFQDHNRPIVELRLKQAGVRPSELITSVLPD